MNNAFSFHLPRLLHQLGKPVKFGENTFKLPGYYPCRFINSSKQHERFLEVFLRRILTTSPGTFIDVGVNAGQTLAKVVGIDRNRSYLGFEPQMSCCFNAEQFIKANDLVNARVLPIALSDNNHLLSFFSAGETDECASLIDQKDTIDSKGQTFVQCRKGDEVFEEMNITQISVIKIDVEGAELQVMEGMKTVLTSYRPPLIFEVLPNFSGVGERVLHSPEVCEKNRFNSRQIEKLLSGIGYQIFQIDEDSCTESMIKEFDLDDVKNFKGSNYIARAAETGH
jgi:FkbM family methyltransferase